MRTDPIWASSPSRRPGAVLALAAAGLVAAAGCATTTTGGGPITVAADRPGAGRAAPRPAHVVPLSVAASTTTTAPTSASDETEPAPAEEPDPTARRAAATDADAADATASGATAGDATATAPVCLPGGLAGALSRTEGAAGHVYTDLVLTNRGTASCRLDGYPGVRFVDLDGTAIGAPAAREEDDDPPPEVLLAPGDSAAALLRITQAGIQDGCLTRGDTRAAAALRVTPPGGSDSVAVPVPDGVTACLSAGVRQLLVGPLLA